MNYSLLSDHDPELGAYCRCDLCDRDAQWEEEEDWHTPTILDRVVNNYWRAKNALRSAKNFFAAALYRLRHRDDCRTLRSIFFDDDIPF